MLFDILCFSHRKIQVGLFVCFAIQVLLPGELFSSVPSWAFDSGSRSARQKGNASSQTQQTSGIDLFISWIHGDASRCTVRRIQISQWLLPSPPTPHSHSFKLRGCLRCCGVEVPPQIDLHFCLLSRPSRAPSVGMGYGTPIESTTWCV